MISAKKTKIFLTVIGNISYIRNEYFGFFVYNSKENKDMPPLHYGDPTIGVKVENIPKRVSNRLSVNTMNIGPWPSAPPKNKTQHIIIPNIYGILEHVTKITI